MENTKKKEQILKLGIGVGALMLAVIHMIGLKWAESRPVADGLSLEGYWLKYLVRLIWAAVLGTVLAALRSIYRKSSKLQSPVTWIAVTVILFFLYCMDRYELVSAQRDGSDMAGSGISVGKRNPESCGYEK